MKTLRRVALLIGVLALAGLGVGAIFDFRGALQGYLAAFIFWLGITWGASLLVFLGEFVGGNWYASEQPALRAAKRLFPWMALAFLPVAIGYHEIYPWAAGDGALSGHLKGYFSPFAFWGRALVILAGWAVLEWASRRHGSKKLAVAGICLYFPLVTIGAVDWMMSLDLPFRSTMYGLLQSLGFAFTAFTWAFFWGLALQIREGGPWSRNDTGNFLLTLVALWAYVTFMQYLIVWSGNLAVETPWYLARGRGGWQVLAIALGLFGFVLPLAVLLFREFKMSRRAMLGLLGVVLLSRLIDVYWHVLPAFSPGHFVIGWQAPAAFFAFGGLFVWGFLARLATVPVRGPAPNERGYGV